MRRREFVAGLGGAAAAWSVAARAQQGERIRRVAVLMGFEEIDLETKAFLSAFTQTLAELGWIDGRTVRIDVRWAAGSVDRARMFAKEFVDLQPDVILSQTTLATAALQRETQTIPIVFVVVYDPIGSGFVAGLPRPGRNITGFMFQEGAIVGKWLELLTEIAPTVSRVAIMFNPDLAPYVRPFILPTFEAATRRLKVEPIVAAVRTDAEIETVITSLGREPGGALLTQGDPFTENHRALIISTVARNNVPAVYPNSGWARDGGLLSYGPTIADEFRRAALYVDRILRGTKPAELPVQLPIKFDMILNAKTAKALGLTIPETLLATADEVIQ
jgi:putative tryptophan/tyrosine transport system substrate-binding protein